MHARTPYVNVSYHTNHTIPDHSIPQQRIISYPSILYRASIGGRAVAKKAYKSERRSLTEAFEDGKKRVDELIECRTMHLRAAEVPRKRKVKVDLNTCVLAAAATRSTVGAVVIIVAVVVFSCSCWCCCLVFADFTCPLQKLSSFVVKLF